MRRCLRILVTRAALLSFALGACAVYVSAQPRLSDAIALSYRVIPLSNRDLRMRNVGRLIYRGGLEINSPDARFGGWSGLIVSKDGTRMLSQSDEAHWLRADLVYDAHGNLAGIKNAQLADMLDMSGHAMRKKEGDAEGLDALTPDGPNGAVIVSFEGDPRVWRYDLSSTLHARPQIIPMPRTIKDQLPNQGLEGLTVLKPGTLLTVSENTRDAHGDMEAWLVRYYPSPARNLAAGQLGVAPDGSYQISDAAMGPSGRYLYLLERHYFGLLGGIEIAVRQIDTTDVRPGVRLRGTDIAEFNSSENIDNMEGLALRRDSTDRTFLYMISDDNYDHLLQRTLLLMFELEPDDQ